MDYSTLSAEQLIGILEMAGRTPPLALIHACLARQDELTPGLLATFRAGLDDNWPHEDDPRWYRAIHAAFLLLAFREEEALPIFEEAYRQGHYLLEWFETRPAFYAAAGLPTFSRLLQMDTGGEYHYGRNMAAELLKNMAVHHPETRDAVVAALSANLPPLTPDGQLDWPHETVDILWSSLAFYLAELRDSQSRPQIEALFDGGWIDPDTISRERYLRYFESNPPAPRTQPPFDIIAIYRRLHGQAEYRQVQKRRADLEQDVDDNVRESVHLKEKPGVKIGRNDPCPCGSGKKYKRCHGRPGRV